MNLILLPLLLSLLSFVVSNKYTSEKCTKDENGEEHCKKKSDTEIEDDDDEEPCFFEEGKEKLFAWDPVKVGHVRNLELENGVYYKMITRAIRPKLFEIPDFLTSLECEHIMALSESFGLSSSGLHIDDYAKKSKKHIHGRSKNDSADFRKWDKDEDGVISLEDVKQFAIGTRFLYLNDSDVIEIFKKLEITAFDDGKITPEEFATLNTDGLDNYMKELRENHPRFRDRYSSQGWLRQGRYADPIMRKLRERIQRLTKLSMRIIEGAEPLQVLRYDVHGHYHAHYDGQSRKQFPELECCHFVADKTPHKCRLCRFITVLYYLNDVEEGGETAFPVADKEDFQHDVFQRRYSGDGYNLSEYCHNASVVISPKQGKAIMWYNHQIDEHGWLGELDLHTLHGGCDVRKGIKWISNNWISSPEFDSVDRENVFRRFEQKQQANVKYIVI